MPSAGQATAAIAAGVLLAAGLFVWIDPLVAVATVYATGVCTGIPPMLRTFRQWQVEQARWSDALVTERVADHAHILARGVQRWVGEAADLVECRAPDVADHLRAEILVLRSQAEARLARWRSQASPNIAYGMGEGYMGGLAMTAPARAPMPLRRFATYQNTPRWLPRALRRPLVQLLRGVDVVRLLHTPEIERRSLVVSLWLRAAFVAAAPFAAGASLTGKVPLTDGGVIANLAWIAVMTFAGITAVIATRVAHYTIGKPTRWPLYAVEQTLTVLAVAMTPCWPVAIFGAGAVNWIERPDWTLRRLIVWLTLTYGALSVGGVASGAQPGDIALEMLIGVAVTAIMAGSYGLMFPATVATFAGTMLGSVAWRVRAFTEVRHDRRAATRVIDTARGHLSVLDSDDPRVGRVLQGLSIAAARLDEPRQLFERRPRTLAVLCSRALTSIVAPEGEDVPHDGSMRCAPIEARPRAVGELSLRSGRLARALEHLLKRVALEAVDNEGRDVLFCALGVDDHERVLITIGNGLPTNPAALRGFGTGEGWIDRWRARIPDCHMVFRGAAAGATYDLNIDIFLVQFTVGTSAFRPSQETMH